MFCKKKSFWQRLTCTDKKYVPNLDTSQLDLCYPAIIQSGGNYKLKFSHVSDKESVHFGAIVVTFGARYRSYCSNIARTFLVSTSWMWYELSFSYFSRSIQYFDNGQRLDMELLNFSSPFKSRNLMKSCIFSSYQN